MTSHLTSVDARSRADYNPSSLLTARCPKVSCFHQLNVPVVRRHPVQFELYLLAAGMLLIRSASGRQYELVCPRPDIKAVDETDRTAQELKDGRHAVDRDEQRPLQLHEVVGARSQIEGLYVVEVRVSVAINISRV